MEVDKFVNIERAVQGPFGAEATFTAESRVGLGVPAAHSVHEQAVGATALGTSAGFQMEISGSQLSKIVETVFEWVDRGRRVGQGVECANGTRAREVFRVEVEGSGSRRGSVRSAVGGWRPSFLKKTRSFSLNTQRRRTKHASARAVCEQRQETLLGREELLRWAAVVVCGKRHCRCAVRQSPWPGRQEPLLRRQECCAARQEPLCRVATLYRERELPRR